MDPKIDEFIRMHRWTPLSKDRIESKYNYITKHILKICNNLYIFVALWDRDMIKSNDKLFITQVIWAISDNAADCGFRNL